MVSVFIRLACWRRSVRVVMPTGAMMLLCAAAARAQANPQGSWSAVFDWSAVGSPGCDLPDEFSHAALIPKGLHAGKVLLWRLEVGDTYDPCLITNTNSTWLFDPSSPGALARIPQSASPFVRSIFCSGASWDARGNLVVAGGVDGSSPNWPRQVYRFRPQFLDAIVPGSPPVVSWSTNPWVFVANMVIPHYYATVIGMKREAVMYSQGSTFGNIVGGSSLILGGPPQWTIEGNEFWEAIETSAMQVREPLLNLGPDSSSSNLHGAPYTAPHDVYALLPTANPAEPRLDSYPRALLLSNGDILVCGDVDSLSPADVTWWDNWYTPIDEPNGAWAAPGEWWVIRPRYLTSSPSTQLEWQLWRSTNPAALGPVDSFYDNVVIMHKRIGGIASPDHVYRLGGSSPASMSHGATSDVWNTNDRFMKFTPSGSDPNVGGSWSTITVSPEFKRVFCGSVVLPDGKILAVGGTSTDDYGGHGGGGQYIPGPLHSPVYSPGTVSPQPATQSSSPQYAPILIDPTNGSFLTMAPQAVPRLYHSLALLLPDGRVLSLGGAHAKAPVVPAPTSNVLPGYSGEIFSPPYLSCGFRPSIDSAPRGSSFGAMIDVTVTHGAERPIQNFVMLRPAAVTHHFDNDQRYIELAFSCGAPSSEPNGMVTEVCSVWLPPVSYGPPGYYMLFAVESNGLVPVPSIAAFIDIQ